jgi:hypothetical protein
MMRTIWMSMLAAAVAACGDNTTPAGSGSGGGPPVPSYRVDGMPGEGAPTIACDTRYTISAGVFDCPNVMVDGDPLHRRQTCPDATHADAPLVSEIWYDDQLRPTRDIEQWDTAHTSVDTTYSYDDIALHERIVRSLDGHELQRDTVVSRTDTGNPLVRTTDWQAFPNYPASAHVIQSFSYDADDRLVDLVSTFSDGNLDSDFAVSYDDDALRRAIRIHWATFPGSGAASTGGFDERLDLLGRLTEVSVLVNPDNPKDVRDYFYDELGRVKRVVVTHADRLVTIDTFYECE